MLILVKLLAKDVIIYRVVTKISSCQVNTTRKWGIKQLGISFDSIFLLFSNESSRGNPWPLARNDCPAIIYALGSVHEKFSISIDAAPKLLLHNSLPG